MIKEIKFNIIGMLCTGCEDIVESTLVELDGVDKVTADYLKNTVMIRFDHNRVSLEKLNEVLKPKGYELEKPAKDNRIVWRLLLVFISVIALVMVMFLARKISHQFSLPDLNPNLSDGMIFLVGLITGLHCIGMCGGFVISYTARDAEQGKSSLFSHLQYGFGKTLSYAMFGAVFGLLGSMVSLTPFIRGMTNLMAGGFLILFGLSMLGAFSWLKRIRIKQPERMAKFAIEKRRRSRSPFFIGFFSGFLLGCGPLQAMYVMAAGSAEPLLGAKILALFGLGTMPALLSFGYLTRLFSVRMTDHFFQLSGLILIFIGAMMFNMGLMRTHSGYDYHTLHQKIKIIINKKYN